MKSPLGVRLSKDSNSWPLATPGIGRNSTLSIQLKTVVLAAMPIASVSTATSVKPGLFSDIRRPNRKSCANVHMRPSSRDQGSVLQSRCHQWDKPPACPSERSSDVFPLSLRTIHTPMWFRLRSVTEGHRSHLVFPRRNRTSTHPYLTPILLPE